MQDDAVFMMRGWCGGETLLQATHFHRMFPKIIGFCDGWTTQASCQVSESKVLAYANSCLQIGRKRLNRRFWSGAPISGFVIANWGSGFIWSAEEVETSSPSGLRFALGVRLEKFSVRWRCDSIMPSTSSLAHIKEVWSPTLPSRTALASVNIRDGKMHRKAGGACRLHLDLQLETAFSHLGNLLETLWKASCAPSRKAGWRHIHCATVKVSQNLHHRMEDLGIYSENITSRTEYDWYICSAMPYLDGNNPSFLHAVDYSVLPA